MFRKTIKIPHLVIFFCSIPVFFILQAAVGFVQTNIVVSSSSNHSEKMGKITAILIIVLLVVSCSQCCLKILIVPGIFQEVSHLQPLLDKINEKLPCAKPEIFSSGALGSLGSFRSIWMMVKEMQQKFRNYIRDYPDGLTLIGVSQGGVVGRALIQTTSEHNVKSFFSFAGPQQGIYTVPIAAPGLPQLYDLGLRGLLSIIFYTPVAQNLLSIANLWKDPTKYELYLKGNNFLSILNNEKPHCRSKMFKDNLLKLDKFVLIMGDKDASIDPWQSGLFGYYGINQYPNVIVNMTDQEIYRNDTLGLKTMYEDGRLDLCFVLGGTHQSIRTDQWTLDNCFFNNLM